MTTPAQVYAVVSLPDPELTAASEAGNAVVYVAFESPHAAEAFARRNNLVRHLVSPLVFDIPPAAELVNPLAAEPAGPPRSRQGRAPDPTVTGGRTASSPTVGQGTGTAAPPMMTEPWHGDQ
ncbi:hypothetical protein [Pseudofrankia sp. DC12]|uniref:hypothetical protein n=1 Tax=Pseudofrankia sp. DC12 TaxID=683315 RepID=UPI0005F7A321|nr:hypothetical protein [Pseudofrankia sp. DC12]